MVEKRGAQQSVWQRRWSSDSTHTEGVKVKVGEGGYTGMMTRWAERALKSSPASDVRGSRFTGNEVFAGSSVRFCR